VVTTGAEIGAFTSAFIMGIPVCRAPSLQPINVRHNEIIGNNLIITGPILTI
jgi:hypothetical protein